LGVELWVVVVGWMLAGGSPGPATLAISSTAMGQGRRAGLALATGVLVGSAMLGCAAALGMSAVMMANVWLFEVIRYVGAAYLLWLAIKSLRAAWYGRTVSATAGGSGRSFLRGLALHLTNPKAILAWGAIYAIALPAGASGADVPRNLRHPDFSVPGSIIATSLSCRPIYSIDSGNHLLAPVPIGRQFCDKSH